MDMSHETVRLLLICGGLAVNIGLLVLGFLGVSKFLKKREGGELQTAQQAARKARADALSAFDRLSRVNDLRTAVASAASQMGKSGETLKTQLHEVMWKISTASKKKVALQGSGQDNDPRLRHSLEDYQRIQAEYEDLKALVETALGLCTELKQACDARRPV